jgi:hypothetical protein
MALSRAVFAAFVIAVPAAASAAPQTFNTALPVAEGEWVVRAQGVYMRADAPMGADAQAYGAVGVVARGIDEKTAVFAVLPWFHKSLKGGGSTRDSSGIGDLRLFVRREIFRSNARGRSFRIAVFGGAELPTGRNRVSDRLGLLPPPLQPGSGSVDPFGGLIATFQTLDFEVDGQLSYQDNRRADGFAFGNVFRADASAQYRLLPRKLGSGLPHFLYATVDAGYRSNARDHAGRAPLPGTALEQFTVAPGLQYVTRRWIFEGAVELPVWQHAGRMAMKEDVTVFGGLRAKF